MKKQQQQQNKVEKKEIEGELEEYKKKLDEYTNDLKRLQAEFENYKKRQEKENAHFIEYSNAHLISRFLVILDDFDSCIKNISAKDEHKYGLLMLHKKILKILYDEGLKEIDTKQGFDPYKHEIVMSQETDKKGGEILGVVQKGYMLKDKVLRHAKVVISKHKEEKKNDDGQSA